MIHKRRRKGSIPKRALQVVVASVVVVASLFLLSFIISATEPRAAYAESVTDSESGAIRPSNSNAVTLGVADAASKLGQGVDSAGHALTGGIQSFASLTAQAGSSVVSGAQSGAVATGRGVVKGAEVAGAVAGKGADLAAYTVNLNVTVAKGIADNVGGFVVDTSLVGSILRPSGYDEVPIIDPDSPELREAIAALAREEAEAQSAEPQADDKPQAEEPQAEAPPRTGSQWPMSACSDARLESRLPSGQYALGNGSCGS
jgi:hypothetical protein